MVAIDEIHKCKNPSSQQGKGILKALADVRIAMSGTPLMNTPLDLFIILRWLGYEKHAFYQFKNHYCVMGGYGGYDVVGYKNMPELQERVDNIMLRRLKDEVLDLPEKVYIDEYVDMTAKQEQIYKEVSATIKANIDKIKMANNPLAELIRMRQATGYTGILSSTILESAKIDRLEEIVEESVANNRKVVIFSNWTQMTTPVCNRLAKNYKGVVITGETNDVDRQVNVNTFQNNPDCNFIIGTIGAMGTGLTLTAGTVVVFLDEPWTMANKQQAIDRCHRIGTKSNITIYTIMCKNTIDERIHEIVEKKGMIADAIIDGKIMGNKTEMLNFLLS
jgi:SNF2 family DNA or RNA helicase